MIKQLLFTSFICLIFNISQAQSKKLNWKEVDVVFYDLPIPGNTGTALDTLDVCGKWLIQNRNSESFHQRVKRKVVKSGCNMVYVDTKNIHNAPEGTVYVFGVKRKEE